MPKTSAHTSLELPPLEGVSDDAQLALNDRMRRIADALDNLTSSSVSRGGSGIAGAELVLTVPGTLGIKTDAAPRVSLAGAVTPSAIVALLKRAPVGASVIVKVQVGGVDYTGVEVVAGSFSATVGGGLGVIAANALVTLNITSVGVTFPGADLTVLVRF